jgi:hypothetical protein
VNDSVTTAVASVVADPLPPLPHSGPLRVVANMCNSGACPTVYETGSGTVVVQGFAVAATRAGIDVPDGEALVEIPVELLAEALRHLS